jgi:hypothetical protein
VLQEPLVPVELRLLQGSKVQIQGPHVSMFETFTGKFVTGWERRENHQLVAILRTAPTPVHQVAPQVGLCLGSSLGWHQAIGFATANCTFCK